MLKLFIIICLMALIFSTSHANAANLITNGSFESPVLSNGQIVNVGSGGTFITSWAVVGNDVSVIQTNYAEAR